MKNNMNFDFTFWLGMIGIITSAFLVSSAVSYLKDDLDSRRGDRWYKRRKNKRGQNQWW